MNEVIEIRFPLINANEPEALLAGLYVENGQAVSKGQLLCSLETTKSTADLSAPSGGYIASLQTHLGQTVYAGDLFCYLAAEPGWQVPQGTNPSASTPPALPEGLRITQPALALATQLGIDLAALPRGILVTESLLRSRQSRDTSASELGLPQQPFDPTAVLVYGAGGHGKSLIDLLRVLGVYRLVGLIDDGVPTGTTILGVPVLGGREALAPLYAQGVRLAVNAVGGIGNVSIRIKIFHRLAEAGFTCPAVVHPTAFIELSARLSSGVQVFPHAYVGSDAQVGFGTIINTGSIVSHDCKLGDYVNISPGAVLAGAVQVSSGSLIGMGATINLEVKIGAGARIGNGATVKSDVPERGVVRAGTIWPG